MNEFDPKSTVLLAYFADGTETTVHFADLVVFVKDPSTQTNYAVLARRHVERLSTDPFYVCVCVPADDCPLVLVPVKRMICACSEMVLRDAVPPMRMVIFHQLSGALHSFE
jgi:hypothetical protein